MPRFDFDAFDKHLEEVLSENDRHRAEDARMAAEGMKYVELTKLVGENALSLAAAEAAYTLYRGQLTKDGLILDTEVVQTDLV